jgi:hypothetical protein
VSRELVLVHGRAQQHKDAAALKRSWLDAWTRGLAKSSLSVPIDESAIHFPYYGDTLAALVEGGPAPDVIVMGPDFEPAERAFIGAVLEEAREAQGVSDDEVIAQDEAEVVERNAQNWRWVRALAKALDARLPGASGATLALVTYDVYHYLRNPGVRDVIEEGVRAAISADAETVVVSHSLGTVVAYNLLRREGQSQGWSVPLHVTLGSPLAVTEIRRALAPIKSVACAASWLNASDRRDIVALYPLEPPRFSVSPAVENKTDVDNHTANRHGIDGYLDDPVVARRIHDALTGD